MDSSDGTKIFNILDAYECRLTNNNIDINVVLYSNEHLYEYNPWTRRIRPFNSICWYDLKDNYDDLLEYIYNDYNEIRRYKTITGYYPEISYADTNDKTVAINIEKLKNELSNNRKAIDQCEALENYISKIYDTWNDILIHIINTYDKDKLSIIFK